MIYLYSRYNFCSCQLFLTLVEFFTETWNLPSIIFKLNSIDLSTVTNTKIYIDYGIDKLFSKSNLKVLRTVIIYSLWSWQVAVFWELYLNAKFTKVTQCSKCNLMRVSLLCVNISLNVALYRANIVNYLLFLCSQTMQTIAGFIETRSKFPFQWFAESISMFNL